MKLFFSFPRNSYVNETMSFSQNKESFALQFAQLPALFGKY